MDLFGTKRIEELETELGRTQADLALFKSLVREMDEAIFRMSQCTSWGPMQPIFRDLLIGTESRRLVESNRIGHIIRTELNKAS
mgnify:CR=1 FL=1